MISPLIRHQTVTTTVHPNFTLSRLSRATTDHVSLTASCPGNPIYPNLDDAEDPFTDEGEIFNEEEDEENEEELLDPPDEDELELNGTSQF